MPHAITTTISEQQYLFLNAYSKKYNKPKNYVLEQGLKLLEAQTLEEAVRVGFEERFDEYKGINREFSEVQSISIAK